MLINELDTLTSERDTLPAKINETASDSQLGNKILAEIDEWQRKTTKKIKEVADMVKQQAMKIMNSKWETIKERFESLSKELKEIHDTKSVLEQDLKRLKQQIDQISEDLNQIKQSPLIKLNTEKSDLVIWDGIIFVEEKPLNADNKPNEAAPTAQQHSLTNNNQQNLPCNGHACPRCGKCTDWYFRFSWERRDGATCTNRPDLDAYRLDAAAARRAAARRAAARRARRRYHWENHLCACTGQN